MIEGMGDGRDKTGRSGRLVFCNSALQLQQWHLASSIHTHFLQEMLLLVSLHVETAASQQKELSVVAYRLAVFVLMGMDYLTLPLSVQTAADSYHNAGVFS